MNRESAALGVPVYSIFRGHIGAVDRYLADTDRLVLLSSEQEIRERIRLVKRERSAQSPSSGNDVFLAVVEKIVSIAEGKA